MFTFKLELESGEPADPETFVTAVPGWKPDDRIFVSPGVSYVVVEVREGVLVVALD